MSAVLVSASSGPWWLQWTLDVPSVAIIAGLTALYLRGAQLRAERSGVRRPRRTWAFVTGALVVIFGQISPVATFSEVLLWPHMVQHLLFVVVAAPLLAAAAPVATVRFALPRGPRRALSTMSKHWRRTLRRIGDPPRIVVATVVHIVTLWLWHAPPLYDAAVANPGLHLLEHVTFLASAVWFWSQVWATARRAPKLQALATACLGVMIIQGGLLGAVLTFANRSLFEVYTGTAGWTALEDQQLAGGLMWVPPGFVYASIAVRRFAGWLRTSEADLARRQQRQRDGAGPAA